MNRFTLEIPSEELDLERTLYSGQVFRWEPIAPSVHIGVDGDHIYRIEREVDSVHIGTTASLDQFIALFHLEVSKQAIDVELSRLGPELLSCLPETSGLRLMRSSDPVETLFCFLCTANNHLARITQMIRVLGGLGEPLGELDGRRLTRFPDLEKLASLPESWLREQGFGYRARTLPRVAQELLKRGPGWLERLKGWPYAEAHSALCALPSVGPKLADCVCLYGLHHDSAAPIDTHLWQAVCRHYFPEWQGKALTDLRYRAAGDLLRERFGSLAGWAHQAYFVENLRNWRKRKAEERLS